METLVGIVILIVLAYLALCLFLYVLRIVIGIIVLIAVPTSLYLFFVMDEHFYAILLFVGVCMLAGLVDDDEDEQTKEEEKKADYAYKTVEHKKQRTSSASNSSMNKALMYLIPIFWPYLILKAIFSEKQVKTDMSPYDYEQHLKSNGK